MGIVSMTLAMSSDAAYIKKRGLIVLRMTGRACFFCFPAATKCQVPS
jgi:hypothetical protein